MFKRITFILLFFPVGLISILVLIYRACIWVYNGDLEAFFADGLPFDKLIEWTEDN